MEYLAHVVVYIPVITNYIYNDHLSLEYLIIHSRKYIYTFHTWRLIFNFFVHKTGVIFLAKKKKKEEAHNWS